MAEFKQEVLAVILAAGRGSRMGEGLPKVLRPVGGKPILKRVMESVGRAGVKRMCLVLGEDLEPFAGFLKEETTPAVCLQLEKKGTADALAAAGVALEGVSLPKYARARLWRGDPEKADWLLVCAGDLPAIHGSTLTSFLERSMDSGCPLAVLGMEHPHPQGYGRLVLSAEGHLEKIVEQRDASPEEQEISLCNTGVICGKVDVVFDLLAELDCENAASEYYLTDIFAAGLARGAKTFVYRTERYREFDGVNDPEQLKKMESYIKDLSGE